MRCKIRGTLAAPVLALFLISLLNKCASFGTSPALDAFFSELDNNHDGAIDVHEASQFIGGSIGGQEFDEPQEAADAAACFLHSIDGGDAGLTVSVDELDEHLHSVLSGVRVWEWIRHGVGLPQYAEAFRLHSITPLDFPVLVQDNGKILEEELGVASPFHRAKVVRIFRRLILGLGKTPSEPQAVTCTAAPGASFALSPGGAAGGGGGRARVHWSPPADPGAPPLHRYVLERADSDGQWRQVAELDDPEPAAVAVGMEPQAAAAAAAATAGAAPSVLEGALGQQVLFRVAAWNLYGRSPYGVAACQLEPMPPPGYPPDAAAPDAANGTAAAVGEGAAAAAIAAMPPARDRQVAVASRGAAGSGGSWGWGWGWSPVVSLGGGGGGDAGIASRSGPDSQESTCPGGRAAALGGGDGEAVCWQPPLAPVPVPVPADGAPELLQVLQQQGPAGVDRGAVDVAALSRSVWASGAQARPRTESQAQPQAQPPAQAQAQAQPNRWWSTLLLAVLPWLLRLLPLRVLLAAACCVRGLLLRAHAALGLLPPQWLQQLQLQPSPWPQGHLGSPLQPGVDPSLGGAAPASVARAGAGGAGRVGSSPSAADPGGADGAAAGGAGLARGSWLDGAFTTTSTVPAGVAAAVAAPVAVPLASQRSGLPPYRVPLPAAAAPSPYGSPGSDVSGLAYVAPRQRGADAPAHRSTSEGDICGLEDAERPSRAAPLTTHYPHPPHQHQHQQLVSPAPGLGLGLHSLLNPHQLAGSAPSLGGFGLPGASLMSASVGGSHAAAAFSASYLGGGGGGGGRGLRESETEADLLVAAAAAAATAGGCGGVSGRGRGKVCAIPGCGRKLDLRHYRDYMRRHYCGRCQRTVCGQHTAYSPHGPTGSCDHVSRCVCTACFTHFNPAYQLFLLKHNKLQPAGGVGPQAAGTGAVAGVAVGLASFQVQPDARASRSGSGNRHGSASGGGGGGGNGEREPDEDGKSAAKLLWERAATKLKAVTRFRKKGVEGHDRDSQALENIAE